MSSPHYNLTKLKFLFFPFHKKVIKPDLQKQIKRLPLWAI